MIEYVSLCLSMVRYGDKYYNINAYYNCYV